MDCMRAQMLVSEKLDGQPVDAAELETAKDHCRSCPECGRFVRALVAMRQTPPPEPSALFVDGVLRAIESNDADADLIAQLVAAPNLTPADTETAPKKTFREVVADPRNRRAVVGWASAAAAVLLFTGFVATAGIRVLLEPAGPPVATEYDVASVSEDAVVTRDASQPKGSALSAAPQASQTATAPPYVVVSGTVYRSSGPASGIDPASLTRFGSTSSSLDASGTPKSREVMILSDSATVYIVDAAGVWQKFDRVSRSYRSRPFALQSGPIATYGQWPTLPTTVTRPTSPDGAPSYSDAGPDDTGMTVYGPGGAAIGGFLVAPGTGAADPAAGNPDWTYWAPVR